MSKNFSQIENLMPFKDTLANLTALPRIEGVTYYATDTKKHYADNGVDLAEIGSGGVGSSSTWESFNADNDIIGNWINTGTGTFTFDGAAPINGTSSYKFVTTAQNDEVKRLFTPVFRNKGKENSISLQYKMDVTGIEVQIYDTATLTIIEQFPLEVSTSSRTLNLPFILKDTSTTIEVRFINTNLTNTPVLFFDDGELSDNPFVYKNLLDTQSGIYHDKAGFGSTNTVIPYFVNNLRSSGSGIVDVINNSVTGFSITALKKCIVNLSYSHSGDTGGAEIGFSLNSNELSTNILALINSNDSLNGTNGIAGINHSNSIQIELNKGDVLRPHAGGSASTNPITRVSLTYTAQAESEHVVTPAKSNINNYSARIANNGVASIVSQDHDAIASAIRTSLGVVDVVFKTGLFTVPPSISATLTINDMTASARNVTAVGFTVWSGNPSVSSIDSDFNISISAQGADVKNATFLAAIPTRRVAYIKDIKPSGTNGGTITSGVWQTRTLNSLYGDTSFLGVNANQITLQSGKYKIKSSAPAYHTTNHQIRLVSVPALIEILGTSEYAATTSGDAQTRSFICDEINITSETTFEIQHRCDVTVVSIGLGIGTSYTTSAVFTQVEVEKIK